MAAHVETRIFDLPPERVFDLVADVERYPEFLPMWREATVVSRCEDGYETDQRVGLGLLVERFHTRTHLDRPRQIVVSSNDGLFEGFRIVWDFAPTDAGGCQVDCSLAFDVQSWLLRATVEQMLRPTALNMVAAFETRARQLA